MVKGNIGVGGLVGYNCGAESDGGVITTSYSRATASGTFGVGGLVGRNLVGDIVASYSTGTVTGDESAGGLVGLGSGSSNIMSSFWDIETSGQTTSAVGSGLTTVEMQTASTFLEAGWDFVDETENGTEEIWWILEGKDYPRLWWELILRTDSCRFYRLLTSIADTKIKLSVFKNLPSQMPYDLFDRARYPHL
jgi:hypothetical protein